MVVDRLDNFFPIHNTHIIQLFTLNPATFLLLFIIAATAAVGWVLCIECHTGLKGSRAPDAGILSHRRPESKKKKLLTSFKKNPFFYVQYISLFCTCDQLISFTMQERTKVFRNWNIWRWLSIYQQSIEIRKTFFFLCRQRRRRQS